MPHESENQSPLAMHPRLEVSERYSLARVVSEGRDILVWDALDRRTGIRCAIKTSRSPEKHEVNHRLQREARTLKRLRSPQVISLLADHSHAPWPFIVLEFAQHGSLQDHLGLWGPMDVQSALIRLLPVLDALEACHAQNVVHADIKPLNLLLRDHWTVLLADFDGAVVEDDSPLRILRRGTQPFMAPEQRIGPRHATHKTDLYGFCATLYALLTTWSPYRLYNAARDSPRWAGLPEPVADVIYRNTRHAPEDRCASVRHLRALLTALQSQPQPPNVAFYAELTESVPMP